MGILDQDSLDRGASCMVRGHGPSPGHDTWCGPGATPMIAQSPADSPGMPGQWVESRPCRRPGPHARADRRPGALVASPDLPTRERRGVEGRRVRLACLLEAHLGPGPLVLVVVLGVPCRLAYVRAADPKYVSLPQFGSYRLGHLPPHPHVRSAARRHHQARRHRRLGDPEGGSWAGPARDTASHSSVGPAIFSRPAWLGGPKGASIPASPASEGSALLTIASRVSSGSSRRRSRSRCAGTTPLPDWSQRMRADGLVNGTVNSWITMARAHLRHAVDADPSLTSAWLVSRKVPYKRKNQQYVDPEEWQ